VFFFFFMHAENKTIDNSTAKPSGFGSLVRKDSKPSYVWPLADKRIAASR
jgi:hypothetical protein